MLETRICENKSKLKLCAVRVKDLVYSYSTDNNRVLNKCNINVSFGEIYALLGSNGCGKTTLINCIICRLRPQFGQITIFGLNSDLLSRNQIGFVPQNSSLYNEFTIEENLTYFARLYRINESLINNKINDLLKLLDLPEKSRLVLKLSDGQKRRVSLCVALIHSPMLVILDEPTVGVDSTLRHQIWQYLQMICDKNSVTVIITTHYIEEARNASTVAYLRDGQIIVEQNPDVLLKKYNCNQLEDVFLKLCENKFKEISEQKLSEALIEENYESLKKKNEIFARFWALFAKNMLTFYRCHRIISFFTLIMTSLALLSLYYIILKHEIQYSLSYHYNDESNFSEEYIRLLSNEKFKSNLEDSEYSVINSVIDGKSKVGITLTSNFTNYFEKIFIDNVMQINGIKVYMESIDITDMNIIPELHKSYLSLIQNNLQMNGMNPSIVSPPFQQTIIYGNSQLNVYDFSLPSFIVLTIFNTSLILSALSIVIEKEEQIFERTIIAGVNSFSYHFAQLIAKLIILIIQVIIFMIITYPIIESRVSNLTVFIVFVYLQGLTGLTFGFLFASFIPNKALGIGVLFLFGIILICFCGIIWPLEALPQFLQYISLYLLPITLPIKSMHCLLFRGWSFGHYSVWIGFVSNIILSIIYYTIAVIYSHFYVFKI